MCGLVGIVTNAVNGFAMQDAALLKELLYVDALRGEDSTGLVAYYNDGEMEVLKEASCANDFLKTTDFLEVKGKLIARGKAALGHNRKKTSGSIKDETAHPFIINGEIDSQYAFMHNGTLTNHYQLKHQLADILAEVDVNSFTTPNTDVDSETLGTLLCLCNGDSKKMEKVLAHVNGAFACMWIDQNTDTLYLLRNDERPLWIGESAWGVVIASEASMIHVVAERNNTKITAYEGVDKHTLYTFKLNQKSVTYKKTELVVKKVLPPTKWPVGRGLTEVTGNVTDLSKFGEVASKNSMKRFRGKFLHKQVKFWVEHCQASNFPSANRYLLLGECLELENTNHVVRGYIDVNGDVNHKDLENTLVYGTICATDYDADNGQLIISVHNCFENVYEAKTPMC